MAVGYINVRDFLRTELGILGDAQPIQATSHVAAGSAQGDATLITTRNAIVTGADGAKGVILPATPAELAVYFILNESAGALFVYPGSGDTINAEAADTAITLPARTVGMFIPATASAWVAIP